MYFNQAREEVARRLEPRRKGSGRRDRAPRPGVTDDPKRGDEADRRGLDTEVGRGAFHLQAHEVVRQQDSLELLFHADDGDALITISLSLYGPNSAAASAA